VKAVIVLAAALALAGCITSPHQESAKAYPVAKVAEPCAPPVCYPDPKPPGPK
jgi:starvation-inducible outer membrane lipoprotein